MLQKHAIIRLSMCCLPPCRRCFLGRKRVDARIRHRYARTSRQLFIAGRAGIVIRRMHFVRHCRRQLQLDGSTQSRVGCTQFGGIIAQIEKHGRRKAIQRLHVGNLFRCQFITKIRRFHQCRQFVKLAAIDHGQCAAWNGIGRIEIYKWVSSFLVGICI